jgi:hypothetical protein
MGHYAAEMMCSTCGQVRCICIQPVIDNSDDFVVEGFEVLTVREFRERFAGSTALNMKLAFKKKYKTRLNAEKAARTNCEEAVEAARFNLSTLKHTLKVTRPWEQKK